MVPLFVTSFVLNNYKQAYAFASKSMMLPTYTIFLAIITINREVPAEIRRHIRRSRQASCDWSVFRAGHGNTFGQRR